MMFWLEDLSRLYESAIRSGLVSLGALMVSLRELSSKQGQSTKPTEASTPTEQ